jgi:hypothetical protein
MLFMSRTMTGGAEDAPFVVTAAVEAVEVATGGLVFVST